MINEKLTELINKDIDGVITPLEKMKLEQYLRTSPEALKLYNELTDTVKSLDNLSDAEPGAGLKERIINSIDIRSYSHPRRKNFSEILSGLIPSPRLALTFGLGIIAGLIIISVLFRTTDFFRLFQSDDLSGTIGLSGSRTVAEIPVNTSGIMGEIVILQGYDQSGNISDGKMNHLQLNMDLKSSDKFAIQFRFGSREGAIEDFSCSGPAEFSLDEGTLSINTKDFHKSTFIVSFKKDIPDHLEVNLIREGKQLYSRLVHIAR